MRVHELDKDEMPLEIQALMEKYPIGVYQIKEGAPYSKTYPGSFVCLLTYTKQGMVGAATLPDLPLEQLKEEFIYALTNDIDYLYGEVFHTLDPQYMTLVWDMQKK